VWPLRHLTSPNAKVASPHLIGPVISLGGANGVMVSEASGMAGEDTGSVPGVAQAALRNRAVGAVLDGMTRPRPRGCSGSIQRG
jgi:hypothetical protein